jgi:hypothetical protein
MLLSSTFSTDVQKPILNDLFDTAWNGKDEVYSKICKVEESGDAYEKDLQMQSPSEISEANEGGMYQRVEIENVRTKTYTHLLYKGEIKISREVQEDSKYKQIYDAVKMLGVAAKRTVERKVAAAMYNGFTSELSPDGGAVFSSHTLDNPLSGRPTTFSNLGTGVLNAANLKARITNGYKTLDEHGDLTPKHLSHLVVPSALSFTAQQLKAPASAGEPGTANNDQNVVSGAISKVTVSHFLSEAASNADTAWFLLDPDEHMFKFFWRVKPMTELLEEEATGDKLFRVRFRFSVGFSDYRGVDGNTGAG